MIAIRVQKRKSQKTFPGFRTELTTSAQGPQVITSKKSLRKTQKSRKSKCAERQEAGVLIGKHGTSLLSRINKKNLKIRTQDLYQLSRGLLKQY